MKLKIIFSEELRKDKEHIRVYQKITSIVTIFLFIAGLFVFFSAQAVEVGWQRVIDDKFHYEEKDPRSIKIAALKYVGMRS